jgi:hypothetical protein
MAPLQSLFAFLFTLSAVSAFTPAKLGAPKVTSRCVSRRPSRPTRDGDELSMPPCRTYCPCLSLILSCLSCLSCLYSIAFNCIRSVNASPSFTPPGVYEDAMADWNQQFPQFAKYGWGPSVQAEKWNGRHAMCE